MPRTLVVVESPTKARTIGRFLRGRNGEVVVEASMGHVRDLPRSAQEIPARYKKEPWARLGVNVDAGFEPIYVIPKERRATIKKLKELLADADELYLATDEDREGESIAWHLTQVLKPSVPVRRMVFHEITPEAIREAFEHPREIDERLVDAQEARRILDRLYGYEVSPVLWKKVASGLSAGRVQSVAVRMVVERERERMAFRPASYWDIEGLFRPTDDQTTFPATLVAVDGVRVAKGRDFTPTGELANPDVVVLTEADATGLADGLADAEFRVRSVERKPYRRSPAAPFRTSTLQQEASRRLRWGSARTMSVAQRLYEQGYITYMRTDSVTLSEQAVATARRVIADMYGTEFVPPKPRVYRSKVKSAQEAHEAIRPAGETWKTPAQVAAELGSDEARLYELIWQRTVASQMPDATGESVSVRLGAAASDGRDAEFAASGRVIHFPGFLRVYVEARDEDEEDEDERTLPALEEGDWLEAVELRPAGHETRPPRRYTEASLIQRLEELGVGRPSTYAQIMSTIQERGYVWKKNGYLVPSFTAFAVVTLLEKHFPQLVDYAFTARMEDDLDRIASGEEQRTPWLARFYLGAEGLREQVAAKLGEIDAREVNSIPIGTDPEGRPIVVRVGRYGPFLERNGDRASVPDDLPPDELTVAKALELLEEQGKGDKILGTDPETGEVVLVRTGRFGPYVQLGDDDEAKPKRASLLKGMSVDEVSLDDALRLLSLPRSLGVDPDTGEEVLVFNGRYGPYVQRGSDRRSLASEDQIFTITLEEALELLREPPRRRGRSSQAPLRTLGEDPEGRTVTVRSGRYGPYVTDGEVNASLRKGDDPETITLERAVELLAERRAKLGK
ncbi:MAG: DNA topoisomerase 1 [Acidimicrobiia bacterium]|nr:MAG: DNA topoisomerase 1 [Acidimicrobiia bacterium]